MMTRDLLEAITTSEGKNMIMELFPGQVSTSSHIASEPMMARLILI